MKILLFFVLLGFLPSTYQGQHPKLEEAYKGILLGSASDFPGLVSKDTNSYYGRVTYSAPSEISIWSSIQLSGPPEYHFARKDSLWMISYDVHPSHVICVLANIIDLYGKYDWWEYRESTIFEGYTQYYWEYHWRTPTVQLDLVISSNEGECMGNTAFLAVSVPLDGELSEKQKKAKKEAERKRIIKSNQFLEEFRQKFGRKE